MLHRFLVAALALGAALPAVAQTGVPFSAERSWQIQRVGSPAITPDGRTIVAPVTKFDLKENKGLTDLWLWSADGSVQRALTTNPASDASPVISPDGGTVAFVSQRNGDSAPQLYLMPLAGGEPARGVAVKKSLSGCCNGTLTGAACDPSIRTSSNRFSETDWPSAFRPLTK